MRARVSVTIATCLLLGSITIRVGAQAPPQVGARGQAPPAGGQRGGGRATFPAQQRPLADPAVIARGKVVYEIHCRACHGADLRGGDMGGPNLLRSQLALNDEDGEVISPIARTGRGNMDPVNISADDAKAAAAYIRSILATGRGQGAPPAGPPVTLNLLVGNAAAGQTYFAAKCSTCHSVTGDLKGIADRFPDVMQLQNRWVGGGGGGGRGGGGGNKPTTVVVTMPTGQKIEGTLGRIDDFIVTLTPSDGMLQSIRRNGAVPKVEVRDPLAAHRQLLTGYTDTDIHNVTAYLVTIK